MTVRQQVTVFRKDFRGTEMGIVALFVVLAMALVTFSPAPSEARDEIVFGAGISEPLGDTADFAATGNVYEVRWRHWNRGNSAYEVVFGYSEHRLEGEVQSTINGFEALIRDKNQLASLQGGPGRGRLVAEYGTFETYYLYGDIMYRFFKRSRISPTVSIGGGAYRWSLPFRLNFVDVPSFGEQRPWLDIGDPNGSTVYAFDFEEVELDYTKVELSGGLNAAFGVDINLTRHFNLGGEARAHLIFSSGTGRPEDAADVQPYLDNMTFLTLQGQLSYRF